MRLSLCLVQQKFHPRGVVGTVSEEYRLYDLARPVSRIALRELDPANGDDVGRAIFPLNHGNRGNAMKCQPIAILTLAFVPAAHTQSDRSIPDFSRQRSEYRSLNRQILAIPEDLQAGTLYDNSGQAAVISAKLHSILMEVIESTLALPRAGATDVKSAINSIQGDLGMAAWDPSVSNLPFADSFQVSASNNMAVIYATMAGGAIPSQSKV